MKPRSARRWRRTGLLAAAVGLLALSGCAGSLAAPSPDPVTTVTSAPTAASATTASSSWCSRSADALKAVGDQISGDITAEFAGGDTGRFQDFRALLVSVCGRPVLQRYNQSTPDDYHDVASVTKSVVATLVGIAIGDGYLKGVDQTLAELLPDHVGDMAPATASVTLRQLLTMTAGLDKDGPDLSVGAWINSPDWVQAILREGSTGAGEFQYSSATAHLLAAILVHATGRPLLDYAREKLFNPLGIETRPAVQVPLTPANQAEYDRAGFAWAVDPQGVNFGGGFMKLKPADLLKLGQLYLDGGRANGHQVVPAPWVHDATTAQVDTHDGFGGPGYGYQWWVTRAGPDPAYAAVGLGGQLIEVVPHRQLVVVFSTVTPANGVPRVGSSAYQEIVTRLIAPPIS